MADPLEFPVEPSLECEQNVGDARADLLKRVFNPKPLKRTHFPEGYLQICVHLGLAFRDISSLVTRYYRAVFQHLHVGQDPVGLDGCVGRDPLKDPGSCDHPGLADKVQFPVLASVGKFVEPGEWVQVRVERALVRLHALDDRDFARSEPFGLILPGAFCSFPVAEVGVDGRVEGVLGEDGELGPALLGVIPGELDQQPHQVVEGRTGVVDDVPDDGAQFWGRLPLDLQPRDVVVGLGIGIVDDGVSVAPDGRLRRVLQFLEVFLNLLHLKQTPDHGMMGADCGQGVGPCHG